MKLYSPVCLSAVSLPALCAWPIPVRSMRLVNSPWAALTAAGATGNENPISWASFTNVARDAPLHTGISAKTASSHVIRAWAIMSLMCRSSALR